MDYTILDFDRLDPNTQEVISNHTVLLPTYNYIHFVFDAIDKGFIWLDNTLYAPDGTGSCTVIF